MENYGSEIGQKMRSAVKAKLLELGTGGSTGYIDDELPDYVMIMVANKRPKQQMITDLNLFLGNQTELFVTWLHEVLQKLQEVTLPAATSKKRSSSIKDDVPSKKDRRTNKKDKKSYSGKKSPEQNDNLAGMAEAVVHTTVITGGSAAVPVITSITEVFAEDLLEKAKKTLDATTTTAAQIKKAKSKPTDQRSTEQLEAVEETCEFNIPTISEISSTTGSGVVTANTSAENVGNIVTSGNREKDLAELAAIQRKIYVAKKLLKEIGELNDDVESDDEDFLNLKDDGSADEFNEGGEVKAKTSKPRSPIVYEERDVQKDESAVIINRNENSSSRTSDSNQPRKSLTPQFDDIIPNNKIDQTRDFVKKRPVHERLGMKSKPDEKEIPRRSRQEKELYVPSFRRKEAEGEREMNVQRNRENERGRDRERHTEHDRKYEEKDNPRNRRSPERNRYQTTKSSRPEYQPKRLVRNDIIIQESGRERNRIGSRVIVAPAKQPEPSDDEDIMDKSMNSVIKIKPRAPVSPSKQACKNLLLRAVAEAQRSTILSKPLVKKEPLVGQIQLKRRLGYLTKDRKARLSLHNHLKSKLVSSATLSQRKNFVIEVERNDIMRLKEDANSANEEFHEVESMYEQGYLSADCESPDQMTYNADEADENVSYLESPHKQHGTTFVDGRVIAGKNTVSKTQFVVTLNDETPLKYKEWKSNSARSRSVSPSPKVSSSSSVTRKTNAEPSSSAIHDRKSPSRSQSHDKYKSKHSVKSRLTLKASSSGTAVRLSGRDSSHSSLTSNTPPPRRTERIEIYRKPQEIKKIIIQNDSEDDEGASPKKVTQSSPDNIDQAKKKATKQPHAEERSTTPPLPPKLIKNLEVAKPSKSLNKKPCSLSQHVSPPKRKRTPIKFDVDNTKNVRESDEALVSRHSKCRDSELKSGDSVERHERKRISIRNSEIKKYDNIPSLNLVALESSAGKLLRPKERCKYHPNCTKQFCEFYHPTTVTCKTFPNCKYSDKCIYSHPKCKYDMSCSNGDCSFSHSGPRNPSQLQHTAPPISSHVVPVQNYKSITAVPLSAISNTMCKYYPNCNKVNCNFFHPKPCRFGKNCINKLECNFYHHEVQSSSKFKWVASLVS